jgi:hypothetical protein
MEETTSQQQGKFSEEELRMYLEHTENEDIQLKNNPLWFDLQPIVQIDGNNTGMSLFVLHESGERD